MHLKSFADSNIFHTLEYNLRRGKSKKRRTAALEMNTDKRSLKPLESHEAERVEFNEPIKLFGVEAEISVKRKKKRKSAYPAFLGFCKLISLFLAFAALFYIAFVDKTQTKSDASDTSAIDKEVAATPSTTISPNGEGENGKFIFLDESGMGINIHAINTDGYTLSPIIKSESGVRVIIMHSHSSERVAEGLGVAALGEELCKRLNEAGIGAFHCTDKFDKNGVIGAYNNMKTRLEVLRKSYPNAALVIDLHNSDVGDELTLSVGAEDSFGWTENLTLALALCRQLNLGEACALRVLPSAIGQDNGLLSLHLGIGGEGRSEEMVAQGLDAFVKAFTEICEK